MSNPLGIDLGTTYSAVAVVDSSGRAEVLRNSDGKSTTPSVVLFDHGEAIVGEQAKNQRVALHEDVVEFAKRQMGEESWKFYPTEGEPYTAEGISAIILKRLTDDAANVLGEPVTQVVITAVSYTHLTLPTICSV